MNNPATMLEFEEESKSLRDYINILRRRKRIMAIVAAAVLSIMIVISFLWPATYRSESVILIEQQDIPSDLVRTTITSYAQQRIEEIKQRIMTIGNIIDIVEEYGLYTERELERKTRTEIAGEFRGAVSIEPISAEVVDPRSGRPSVAVIAFSLAFDGDNPLKVQKVTSELTTLYLDENLKERTSQTKSTTDFLTAEAKVLSGELENLDAKIAEFKEINKGTLPELIGFNRNVVDRTEREISNLTFEAKELQKSKIQIESDLVQLSPNSPVVLLTGETVLADADRLKALRTQLRRAEAAYKENHPTVIRLRREMTSLLEQEDGGGQQKDAIKQLRIERDRLAELTNKYTSEHPQIIQSKKIILTLEKSLKESLDDSAEEEADNPTYLLLKARLQGVEEDIRANKEKITKLRTKIEKYEGYLSKAPQVEKDFQRLIRDYQNTNQKYQEIRAKQRSAELATSLETEQKGERFTLIQPAELPSEPVSPNRTALILLGAILALGAGVGVALLLEALDDGIYSVSDVVNITGLAPLVVVGYMETKDESKKHIRKRIYIVIGLILIGVLSLVLFHNFIKPLDVTWYILLRRLGIS